MKKYINASLIAGTIILATPLSLQAQTVADEIRYGKCMDIAVQAPDKAINLALVWQNEGGGVPARHCEALGLFHLQEYGEAAARLEKIAQDMRVGRDMPVRRGKRIVASAEMLADMYNQTANAWLLANELTRAETAVDTALSLTESGSPQEMDLLVDRARIAAADEDFELALDDLERVQQLDPGRKDILVLLAAAARGTENYAKALIALDNYQAVYSNRTAGYLERGNLLDALGQKKEARQSWLKLLQITDIGPDADAARANLERLDVDTAK